jgi:hypothetical protein
MRQQIRFFGGYRNLFDRTEWVHAKSLAHGYWR